MCCCILQPVFSADMSVSTFIQSLCWINWLVVLRCSPSFIWSPLLIEWEVSWQSIFSNFANSLPSLYEVFPPPRYIASVAVLSSWINDKPTIWHIWLACQFMMSQHGHWPLFYKWLDWWVENGKKNALTDWEWVWSFYWICAGISGYCGTHLIPVTRIEIDGCASFC